ncbi:MAG: aminotransferase class I/II-fold pyridoxal phosphate-dependent enzyme [Armatimonadota bacterium]|nr:aminotransferase class I/II-fold pyridoxal phosphate-dependent enzyme [bacterium]
MKAADTKPGQFEDFLPNGDGAELFAKVDALANLLDSTSIDYIGGLGLEVIGPIGPRTLIREPDGETHPVIMLGSNSYLSLTTHPRVVAAAKEACDRYGYGMGAVSLYSGTTDLHRDLERRIAEFYKTEDAIIIPCGYSANVGVISCLCGPGDVIICDAYNHASIFDGCKLSGADVKVYLHRNMKHLERILKSLSDSQAGRLIITDGVFSMDGDIAPLDEIVDLAKRYGARVMVDDAHGVGVVGPTGRGSAEAYGCMDRIDINLGTLSKTPGAVGGYCAGSARLIQYLRFYTRTYFFSTSLPPPVVAGLNEVFKLLIEDAAGREELWHNVQYMRDGLKSLGFDTGNTQSAIIPIMVGDEGKLGRFNNDLRRGGLYTNVVTYPAVRRKECHLRLCVMNSLTKQDMDQALSILGELGKKHGII